jgi:hypothetical protein
MLELTKSRRAIAAASLLAGLTLTAGLTPAMGGERAGINLGTTSFFDGFGGLAPGCTAIAYMGHEQYNQLNGSGGKKVQGPPGDADLGATYFVPQLVCNSSLKLFGGTLGWNTIVPVAGQNSNFFETNGTSLGDVTAGPYIQFPPVISNGRPVFSQAVEFAVIAPTGKYDASKPVNPATITWSINPFWRATWLPAPQWEVSWRANYIHNFDHRSTVNAASPIPGMSLLRNGDGAWVNFTASRELFKDFHFGLNGYYLKQFSGDTLRGGTKLSNAQESLYIGPGFHYTLDPKNIVNFNVYLPVTDVNAMSGGYKVNLMYIHPLN